MVRSGAKRRAARKSHNEEPGESKNKIIPSSPRGARLREDLFSKILPWQEITISPNNFPYHTTDQHTKSLLKECVASNLKHNNLRNFRSRLKSSSERILLQSLPGTEPCRERLVSEIARESRAPLLKLLGKEELSDDEGNSANKNKPTFNKGDRVQYVGEANISFKELNYRTLSEGQRGEVYEVKGERVAVVFNICGLKKKEEEAEEDEKSRAKSRQAFVVWLDAKDVKQDLEARIHDCFISMEVLYQVMESQQPLIVYFPDSFSWPPMLGSRNEHFMRNMIKNFCQLPEGVVMICAANKWINGFEEREEFSKPLKEYIERLQLPQRYEDESEIHRLFTNVVSINPLKDEDFRNTFVKHMEERRLKVITKGNLKTMHKVLKDHKISCTKLELPNIDITFTREKVEKIVGWATNHHLSCCSLPCVEEDKLHIPCASIKLAISRMMEEDNHAFRSTEQLKDIEDLASGEHEESLVSSVVRSEDIGVKFDDVGALENVKKLLVETVTLPIRRPELFSRGNLLKPCRGILLFGPPGTGKTLIAKALATESGANFINVTAATLTSKWVGETENLTRALFTLARKLAPVIIFVDEADSLLGARGQKEHATSRLNEFMAGWDGLISNEKQRIWVVGATNRPFDLDEAVVRRMPRRIYVGLPDVENRSKILKVLLEKENVESEFSYEQLAEATEGYSGSDLKNLCVAAAYRPIEEFREQETKGEESDGVPPLMPLNLNDFILSKFKVRPSVSHNATSVLLRKWNEQYGEG